MRPANHMRVGAIDIGSNSVRLLVAEFPDGPWSREVITVARAGEACRLGRGLGRTGRIEPGTAERAAVLAAEFARRARGLGAATILIGATAALREAENGGEVAAAIGGRAGIPVRVLSGDEEARMVYRAVVLGLGPTARESSCVVFDIGGGSTEVVSGAGERTGRWTSLPFGAVSLTERHLTSNPITDAEVAALRAEVRSSIMHQCAYMPERSPLFAGVGGTITVLGLLDRELSSYDPGLLEGWCIRRGRLEALIGRLLRSSRDERRGWPAMGEGRADIVVAGALVVGLLAERFPSEGLFCSTQGLRYGLARLAAQEALDGGASP